MYGIYGMNYGPPPRQKISTTSVADNVVSGLGLTRQDNGLYAIPGSNLYYSGNAIYQPGGSGYTLNNQDYGKYTGDVKGFIPNDDDSGYDPSIAYLMALNSNRKVNNYQPMQNTSVYTPASGNLLSGLNSLLMAPPAVNNNSYGAGRFSNGGLLGSPINYAAPQTVAK